MLSNKQVNQILARFHMSMIGFYSTHRSKRFYNLFEVMEYVADYEITSQQFINFPDYKRSA